MTESPNTVRPRHYPEDLRAVVSEALPLIAKELDELHHLCQNGNLDVLREIGDLRFSFESFRDRLVEAAADENSGHVKTQRMLSQLMSNVEGMNEDFEAFKVATNEAIADLKKRYANGHAS